MTLPLENRRILLVIGGGIAAYKALDLIRRLRERGASVRPLLTQAAQEFVTPLSAASLAGQSARTDLWAEEAEIGHIKLARDADAVVVAPATANLMARMATGQAPDLAGAVLLATTAPILIAPAMNVAMWAHPATRRNLATLLGDGVRVVGPNSGPMAEPETGPGRMAEAVEIAEALATMLSEGVAASPGFGFLAGRSGAASAPLAGRRVLVTSGPTQEPIDPVRFIANRSSGRQGHAIAAAAAAAGASVTLVSGPVSIPDPEGVTVVRVETAREMLAAVEAALPVAIAVFAAAVADWRPADARGAKIKKDGTAPVPLTLVENPDILATIAARTEHRPALVVGFAAETNDVLDNARKKIARKGCDLIVANDVSAEGGVLGGLRNTVHLVGHDGAAETWPTLDKDEVGRRLVTRLSEMLGQK